MEDISKVLKQAGFKPVVCAQNGNLTPQETDHIEKIQEDVKNYLKKIDKAYKASKHSTLRFDAPIKRKSCKSGIKKFLNQNQHQ